MVRILAFAGLILLGIGAFLPIGTAPIPNCTLAGAKTFFDPNCKDDAETLLEATHLGIIVLIVAAASVVPAYTQRPMGLWTMSLTALSVVIVLLLYVNALYKNGIVLDFNWGWGALFSGPLLMLLAALLATINRTGT